MWLSFSSENVMIRDLTTGEIGLRLGREASLLASTEVQRDRAFGRFFGARREPDANGARVPTGPTAGRPA